MLIPKPYLREISLKREKVLDGTKYPFTIPAVRHLDVLRFDPDVTFSIGENGAGKSTLLEAISIALGFNAEGGTKNFKFSTRASHSELHTCLRLVKSFQWPRDGYFLRAESFFNVATEIERLDKKPLGPPIIDSYGGHSLHEQTTGSSGFAIHHRDAFSHFARVPEREDSAPESERVSAGELPGHRALSINAPRPERNR
jgi:predicted ATPase